MQGKKKKKKRTEMEEGDGERRRGCDDHTADGQGASVRDGGKALAAVGVVVDGLVELRVELHATLFAREAVHRQGCWR